MTARPWLVAALILVGTVTVAAGRPAVRFTETTNIRYGTSKGVAHYLNSYVPTGTGPWPAIVLIHGGGWVFKAFNKDSPDITPVAKGLAESGYFVAVPNYRLAPAYPYDAGYRDLRKAFLWTASRTEVIPSRIGLMGGSAGGNLAALLAVRGVVAKAWVGMSGAYDFNSHLSPMLGGLIYVYMGPNDSLTRREKASPITFAQRSPPAYLTNFVHDSLVGYAATPSAQMSEMATALTAAGVEVHTELIPGTGHAFDGWLVAGPRILTWLRSHV